MCVYFSSLFYFLFCISLHLLHRAYCTVIAPACALFASSCSPILLLYLGHTKHLETVAHSKDLIPDISLHRHDWQRVLHIQPPG
jgi:hypothetical protein